MEIPRDRSFDETIPLFFTEGYRFIGNRCRELGTDIFLTRILLKNAVCMMGAEAAAQFYHPGRFTRRGAMPTFILTLLQDEGSVMTTDGEDHRRRKAMFLSLMTPAALARFTEFIGHHWRAAVRRWEQQGQIVFFHEAHLPLCAAICDWAGLQLSEPQIRERAEEFEAMVEGAGSMGPRNWRGHRMRARSEHWIRGVIEDIRSRQLQVRQGSAADVISTFRDANGQWLDVPSAAVELMNILRPTVANARYIVFAAMALHEHPAWRERLATSDDHLGHFVDEVRRFYPFIPAMGGRVLTEFTWRNHRFEPGDWVLFDLYGTNHDERIWEDPENFRPERFQDHPAGPFDLVSHGAGDRSVTHRCPGEWMTVELMKTVVRLLVREMSYELPDQDLRIDLTRIPALPHSRFLMSNARQPRRRMLLAS